MRILMVHNRYQTRGGEDESADLEVALLRQFGVDVDLMLFDNKDIVGRNLLSVGLESVWSQTAFRRVRDQISQTEYDLIHIQNFFPLISPAVYYAAKAAQKPVVQALRNYRLICLNALLFRDGHVCEDCLRWPVPWPGMLHRCYRSSFRASFAIAGMLMVHRILGTWRRKVDGFYTLSEFARSKLVNAGISGERVWIKPNLIYPDPGMGRGERKYAFLAGRLTKEKGIQTVLDAWTQGRDQIPLMIAGEGPMAAQVEAASRRFPWITYLGRIPNTEVHDRMGGARFVILPSEWYEVFSRILVEACAKGTPILASNIGSVKEYVEDHRNGLIFEPGDGADLARKVQWAWDHPEEMEAMGRQARKDYEQKYSAKVNYQRLTDIYQRAIINNASGSSGRME
jgi:glycosyltransferase involved in cell wall biosynthesis